MFRPNMTDTGGSGITKNLLEVNINNMPLNQIGCQIFHAVFEGNSVNTSVYSISIDKSLDPFDSIWLKLLTILVYIVEVIASIVMLAFVAYEAKGLAGHFRTLINHLLSYLYGGVSFAM